MPGNIGAAEALRRRDALAERFVLCFPLRPVHGETAGKVGRIGIKEHAVDRLKDLRRIVDLMLNGLRKRLEDQMLHLEVTDAAKDYLIDQGYDPVYGARPLRRVLQTKAETLIAKAILSGSLSGGDTLTLDMENGQLVCIQPARS